MDEIIDNFEYISISKNNELINYIYTLYIENNLPINESISYFIIITY